MDVVVAIKESLGSTFNGFAAFIPKLLGALVILLIGWLIARAIRFALSKVLKAVNFDALTEKVGINGYMAKAGLKARGSDLIAKLGYWIVMLTVLIMFFNSLGLEAVSGLLQDAIQFIPNIIVACILLVVGMYVAQMAQGLAVGALKAGGFDKAELVGKITYGAIMFLIVTMVLNQLHIGDGIIDKVISIILGALGLGLSIAFGLGAQDWVRKTINGISGK